MDLSRFVRELESMGLSRGYIKRVKDLIKAIYMAEELPYEREIKTAYRDLEGNYPVEKIFDVEELVVKILRQYGLIFGGMTESTTYGEYANVRYYRLTKQGLELGSQIYLEHLSRVKDELRALLREYPKGLIRVMALSSLRKFEPSWLRVSLEATRDLDVAVLDRAVLELELADPEKLRRLYEESKIRYGNLKLVDEYLEEEVRAEIYNPRIYEILMARVLIGYDGEIHREALRLMEDLCELGLALKVPVFDSKGRHVCEVYTAPPELSYLFLRYSASTNLEEALKVFLRADLLSQALKGGLTKGKLLEAIRRIGVSEAEVRLALKALYQQGITSRYNEEGDLGSPAFIVLDEEGALKEIENAVRLAEEIILTCD